MSSVSDCIFCKIVAGRIPANKAYEDEELLAFHDIHPSAPVHLLVIPKKHIETLYDVSTADAGVLGRLMTLAPALMRDLGASNGFKTLINTGADGGQEVPHLHVHLMGGPRPWAKG